MEEQQRKHLYRRSSY